jgi:hypothetical protein
MSLWFIWNLNSRWVASDVATDFIIFAHFKRIYYSERVRLPAFCIKNTFYYLDTICTYFERRSVGVFLCLKEKLQSLFFNFSLLLIQCHWFPIFTVFFHFCFSSKCEVIPQHAMTSYGGLGIYVHSFLSLTLREDDRSV